MTESRTERADFQATADPALIEAADHTADVKLLTYEQLYRLWERQQWQTQELDFSRDREDWNERFDDQERFQRMYGLSSFFIGEQKVLEEALPVADGVLSPPWAEADDRDLFGYSLEATRKFAGTCLMRRLEVIGLG